MAGSPDLTWEICERADQALVETLSGRRSGGSVTIQRGAPRAAAIELAASDPASAEVREADRILRVTASGWTDPLFVGRLTQRGITFDGETESIQVNALDAWIHLVRAIILNSGVFPSGIRSYRSFNKDQVQIIADLINSAFFANDTGILPQGGLPLGPTGPGTMADDGIQGNLAWTSVNNAKVEDGSVADAHADAFPALHVETHLLRATNFGFNIPAGATITGIQARVKAKTVLNSSNTSGNMVTNDKTVQLRKASGAVGSNKANAGEWAAGVLTSRTYGGQGDLWGTGFSVADVNNSGFGIQIAAQSSAAAGFGIENNYDIDFIEIIVYWTDSTGEQFFTPAKRNLSFPAGSSYGDAIESIFALEGAPEWELQPVGANASRELGQLNVFFPRQGSDKTATVQLKIGTGDPNADDDNITGLSFAPAIDGLINKYTLIGDANGVLSAFGLEWPTHPTVQAKHQGSIDEYGTWEASESASGVTDFGTLAASARAMVGANAFPALMFSADLDPDDSPEFSPEGDFWIGDIISLTAELPSQTLNLEGRVAAATFVEDENGDVEITISCEPDTSLAGVSSSQLTTIVDASDGQVPPPPEPPEPPEPPPAAAAGGGSKGHKKKKKKKKH